MKVEQKDVKPFQPITITLETEEEAIVMWHRLNVGMRDYFDRKNEYAHHRRIENRVSTPMWELFNDTFDVRFKEDI